MHHPDAVCLDISHPEGQCVAHFCLVRICMGVTLGLYRNRSVERIKGNQATFNNSQRNNLRSCVWVFGGSVREDVRADFLSSR